MKKYVPIIIGIVALFVLLYVGNNVMKKRQVKVEQVTMTEGVSVNGKVVKNFEGEQVVEYMFSIPETATTTVEKDGALVKVSEEGVLVNAMYFSYEGARGYSASDYVANVIIPAVPSAKVVGTTSFAGYDWDIAESELSVWRVAKVGNGSWLLVVENKKTEDEKSLSVIDTLTTK
jgi:extradiol dioxygenase family protein